MPAHRRRRKRRQFTLSRDLIRRLLFVVPFVLVAGLLTIAVSGANILRAERPDLALTLQPLDARAHARAAQKLFTETTRGPARLAEVERLARDALRRDPTVVPAWSMLGLVAAARNQPDRAAAMYRFSGRLSHRDLATQLWMIEERVQANDIEGALRHYDTALRTSSDSFPVLFPVLVSATANDGILPPLARLLNTMPPWRRDFLERLAAEPPDAARFVRLAGMIAGAMSADEKNLVAVAMRGMVERRQYQPAAGLYRLLAGAAAGAPQTVRNGDFARPNLYPPLDWQLQGGADFGAEQLPDTGGAQGRLRIYGVSGAGGLAARQLLLLPPGRYQIAALTAPVDDARPAPLTWTVHCANPEATVLMQQALPPASGPGRPGASFLVPAAGCAGQWLDLSLRADFNPGNVAAWIDSIVIRRIG